jgi:hypothetical protein
MPGRPLGRQRSAPPLPRLLDPSFGPITRRPPTRPHRGRRAHQDDGHGESSVGCASHTRRAPEARHPSPSAPYPASCRSAGPAPPKPGGRSSRTTSPTRSRSTSSPCPRRGSASSSFSSSSPTTAGGRPLQRHRPSAVASAVDPRHHLGVQSFQHRERGEGDLAPNDPPPTCPAARQGGRSQGKMRARRRCQRGLR